MQVENVDNRVLEPGDAYRDVVEIARGLIKRVEPRHNEYLRQIREEQCFPEEVWRLMAEAGFFGLMIPEEFGVATWACWP